MSACEVAIVGAGPAGSTMALRLAQLGHRVCMIEAKAFPRSHIGEALSPGVRALLEFLRVNEVARGAVTFDAADICWTSEGYERNPMDPRGFTVDRGLFDARLVDAARAHGVTLLQPVIAVGQVRTQTGWRIGCRAGADAFDVNADFLVDASGRRGLLPKSRTRTSPPTAALYGYWTGSALPELPRILADTQRWYWGSPVPGGRFNVMAFTDASDLRNRAASLTALYRQWAAALKLDASVALDGSAASCDATCYIDEECVGKGYLKIGEAAFAIDPLSSSGVQAAMQSALAGAVAVHTALLRPQSAAVAKAFYADHVRHVSTRHRRMSAMHYAETYAHANTPFWRARSRAVPDERVTSGRFDIHLVPCAVGDFIEMRAALHDEALPRPIAFAAGAPLILTEPVESKFEL